MVGSGVYSDYAPKDKIIPAGQADIDVVYKDGVRRERVTIALDTGTCRLVAYVDGKRGAYPVVEKTVRL